MITKEQLTKLFYWGNRTKFPLRKEGITSKYMGYDVFVSYAKYGKNEKRYRKKLFDDDIYEIIKNDDIIHASYCEFTSKTKLNPHKDPDIYSEKYKRIHIPLFIPDKNECYMEWTDSGARIIWEEGQPQVCDVMRHIHHASNESDKPMEFLFLDVKVDTEVEL